MNELGLTAPDSSQGDRPTTDQAPVARVAVKRPYVAPAIVEFGSVQEFTRGSGSASTDARRTTRVRAR